MPHRLTVLYLLRSKVERNCFNEGVFNDIKEVIENSKNDDDYVYYYIYSSMDSICGDIAKRVIKLLEDTGRL